MLIWLAGGAGSSEDKTANQKRWQQWCENHLSRADLRRMKKKEETATKGGRPARFQKNTDVQVAAALAAIPHRFRLYTDGSIAEAIMEAIVTTIVRSFAGRDADGANNGVGTGGPSRGSLVIRLGQVLAE